VAGEPRGRARRVVFCASATEALHLLHPGPAPGPGRPSRPWLFPGEHSACLNPLADWDVRWMPGDPAGCATVVQMAASNETRDPLPHAPGTGGAGQDAAQAWGKVPVTLADCDAAVFSGHKIGGPRGAAVLWNAARAALDPVMEGPQERRRRGGTEDLPAILGLAEAVRELARTPGRERALGPLRDALRRRCCPGPG